MQKQDWIRPGWKEYLLALACTALLGYQFQLHQSFKRPQSAGSYYSQEPFVMPLQILGMGLLAAIVLTTVLWLIFLDRAVLWSTIMKVASSLGVVTVWTELAIAHHYSNLESTVYLLTRLPIVPINSAGIIGSSVFLGYLVLSAGGKERSSGMVLMKVGLVLCFAVAQRVLWDVFAV